MGKTSLNLSANSPLTTDRYTVNLSHEGDTALGYGCCLKMFLIQNTCNGTLLNVEIHV